MGEGRRCCACGNADQQAGACARPDAEVYPDPRVESFINNNYVPVKIHIKEQPKIFERFGAQWTPMIQVLDPDGTKRHQFEGFLPPDDFQPSAYLI